MTDPKHLLQSWLSGNDDALGPLCDLLIEKADSRLLKELLETVHDYHLPCIHLVVGSCGEYQDDFVQWNVVAYFSRAQADKHCLLAQAEVLQYDKLTHQEREHFTSSWDHHLPWFQLTLGSAISYHVLTVPFMKTTKDYT